MSITPKTVVNKQVQTQNYKNSSIVVSCFLKARTCRFKELYIGFINIGIIIFCCRRSETEVSLHQIKQKNIIKKQNKKGNKL